VFKDNHMSQASGCARRMPARTVHYCANRPARTGSPQWRVSRNQI